MRSQWKIAIRLIGPLTYNAHDDRGLPGRDLLKKWQDLVDDKPLVQVREQFP